MHLNYQVTFTKMTVCLQSLKSEREKERERERERDDANKLFKLCISVYVQIFRFGTRKPNVYIILKSY